MNHTQKYNQEEIDVLIKTVEEYKNEHNGSIDWTEMVNGNLILKDMLMNKAAGEMKYLRAAYYRNVSMEGKPKTKSILPWQIFTEEETARIRTLVDDWAKGKNYDRLPWGRMFESGIFKEFTDRGLTLEQIRNRYAYDRKKVKGTAYTVKHQSKAVKIKSQLERAKAFAKHDNAVVLAHEAVEKARQAEVIRQEIAAKSIKHCPYCGHSLVAHMAIANQ